MPWPLHLHGLGVLQARLEAGGVGVGEVVTDAGLREHRLARAGHRQVDHPVHLSLPA
jgi:hypothetical protein